jgi:hypothetical protein
MCLTEYKTPADLNDLLSFVSMDSVGTGLHYTQQGKQRILDIRD